MEPLHTLVDGIYNLKEHMTDNEYIEMMTSINKLKEIISSYHNTTKSYYSDVEKKEMQKHISLIGILVLIFIFI